MTALLTSIFGASWRTTVVGLLQLAIGTGLNYYQSLAPGAKFDTHVLIVQIGIARFWRPHGKYENHQKNVQKECVPPVLPHAQSKQNP